jgi:hypothetical protein
MPEQDTDKSNARVTFLAQTALTLLNRQRTGLSVLMKGTLVICPNPTEGTFEIIQKAFSRREMVPWWQRILSVADMMEAMSSHHPYRLGMDIDAALDELVRGKGTLFDAHVVEACIALFREDGYVLPQ